jgi:hypothetical protein
MSPLMSRAIFALGGLAAGLLSALGVTAAIDKPSAMLIEAQAKLEAVNEERDEFSRQAGKLAESEAKLLDRIEELEIENEQLAEASKEVRKDAMELAMFSIDQQMPGELRDRKTFAGGVAAAEKALQPFFDLRLELKEKEGREPIWQSELTAERRLVGVLAGYGSRDAWRAAKIVVSLTEGRDQFAEVDHRNAIGALLRAFAPELSRAEVEQLMARCADASKAAPKGASIEFAAGSHRLEIDCKDPGLLDATLWPYAGTRADLEKAVIFLLDRCQVLTTVNESLRKQSG